MSVNHDETTSSTNTEVNSEQCVYVGPQSDSTQETIHISRCVIVDDSDLIDEDDPDELVIVATKCAVGLLRGGPVGLLISLGMHFLFSDE